MGQTSAQRQAKWRRQHPAHARAVSRSAQQKRRDALRDAKPAGLDYPDVLPEDDAEAMIEWAKTTLVVPPGHHLEGQPMALPSYGEAFIRSALAPGCKDGLLCMGAKGQRRQLLLAWSCTFS